MKIKILLVLVVLSIVGCTKKTASNKTQDGIARKKLRALIIDGQNNHGVWPKTTAMMKDYIEQTGLFTVDIARMKNTYQGPHHGTVDGLEHNQIIKLLSTYSLNDGRVYTPQDSIVQNLTYAPDFKSYNVVISNFGWQTTDFSPEVRESFENYMRDGGGLVVIHAANNAWGDWQAFNEMIGVGGWGNRSLEEGNQIYYQGIQEIIAPSNGEESSHGPEMEFILTTRASEHPIMKGLPKKWMHTKDELYDRLRGPAENVTVLATAFSDVEGNAQPWALDNKGSGRDEPLLMAIDYGKGRVFHNALGHMDFSMESVGFITTLQRGVEWAATGQVTQEVPSDFPTVTKSSSRKWVKKQKTSLHE